jgi:hypothetical protein
MPQAVGRKPPGHRPLSAARRRSVHCLRRPDHGVPAAGCQKTGTRPSRVFWPRSRARRQGLWPERARAVARWRRARSCGARAQPSWPAPGVRPTRRRLPCRARGARSRAKRTISAAYSALTASHSVSVTRPVLRRRSTCRRAAIASLSLGSMVFSWTAVGKGVRCQCARACCAMSKPVCSADSSTRRPTSLRITISSKALMTAP